MVMYRRTLNYTIFNDPYAVPKPRVCAILFLLLNDAALLVSCPYPMMVPVVFLLHQSVIIYFIIFSHCCW